MEEVRRNWALFRAFSGSRAQAGLEVPLVPAKPVLSRDMAVAWTQERTSGTLARMGWAYRFRKILEAEGVLGLIERVPWGKTMVDAAVGTLAGFWARVQEAPAWATALLVAAFVFALLWLASILTKQPDEKSKQLVDSRGNPAPALSKAIT